MGAKQDKGRCDLLASCLTRRFGICEFCGRFVGYAKTDTSHYVSRSYSWTRSYEPNLVASCRQCHNKHGEFPGLHYKDFVTLRGAFVEEEIQKRAMDGIGTKFDWGEEVDRLLALTVDAVADFDILPEAEMKMRKMLGAKRLRSAGLA